MVAGFNFKILVETDVKFFKNGVVSPKKTPKTPLVTGAFFPDTWNYDKFIKQMWNIGDEMNKVVLGFLRQLLGVNKKTCNTSE